MINLSLLKKCSSLLNTPFEKIANQKIAICTDNRKYKHPSCFVAIPGLKVNPLDLIEAQLEMKIPLVIYEQNDVNKEKITNLKTKYPETEFLAVKDAVTFLQEVSHLHIKEWKNKNPKNTVFAISGSNGKTTHKEMLSHILNTIKPNRIVATEKNNNNHLGVPLTLLNVNDETEVVVLELGSNHPGEIKVLCDIAEPNAGLTTNIGATHLEFFGTEKEVFLEEGYLYHAVKQNTEGKGFYLINVDDKFLSTFDVFEGAVPYGTSAKALAKISYHQQSTEIMWKNDKITVQNNHITGNHNKLNLITTAFIASHLYPELKNEIVKAAASFKPTKNRSEWLEIKNKKVFLDAYNANPSSMKASLEGFKDYLTQENIPVTEASVVLGDMNELGSNAPAYHEDVARFVKELGFKNVYFVGRYRQDYLKGFPEAHGKESAAIFKNEFNESVLNKYRFHFIKGSRSLQLESLFDIT